MANGRTDLQFYNMMQIYRYLYDHKEATKSQIVQDLKISFPTVTSNLKQLVTEGKVIQSNETLSSGGRPATVYRFNSLHRLSIGIEVDVAITRIVAVDLYGSVIRHYELPLPYIVINPKWRDSDPGDSILSLMDDAGNLNHAYFEQLADWASSFIKSVQADGSAVIGIGMAFHSLIAPDGEHLLYGINTTITRSYIARYFEYPITLIHDIEAAAIAETWQQPILDFALYLSINKHLGSALIMSGKVIHTPYLSSGTIEHMVLHPGGEKCWCQKRGCADNYCSGTALSHRSGCSLDEFFRGLRNGNAEYMEIWNRFLADLALLIDNARMVISCDIIIGDLLENYLIDEDLEKLNNNIRESTTFKDMLPRLIRGKYGLLSAVTGAALIPVNEYLTSERLV